MLKLFSSGAGISEGKSRKHPPTHTLSRATIDARMYIESMFILFIISISFAMFAVVFSSPSAAPSRRQSREKYDFYIQSISRKLYWF